MAPSAGRVMARGPTPCSACRHLASPSRPVHNDETRGPPLRANPWCGMWSCIPRPRWRRRGSLEQG
eukprot:12890528-Prorocentrum_lima.AAC.1